MKLRTGSALGNDDMRKAAEEMAHDNSGVGPVLAAGWRSSETRVPVVRPDGAEDTAAWEVGAEEFLRAVMAAGGGEPWEGAGGAAASGAVG